VSYRSPNIVLEKAFVSIVVFNLTRMLIIIRMHRKRPESN